MQGRPDGFLNSSDKGAWGESLVCANLLARQISVWRAISPSAPVDLFILLDGEPKRVEVKCVSITTAREKYPVVALKETHKSLFDHLALVFPNGDIHYLPSLDGPETVTLIGTRVYLHS